MIINDTWNPEKSIVSFFHSFGYDSFQYKMEGWTWKSEAWISPYFSYLYDLLEFLFLLTFFPGGEGWRKGRKDLKGRISCLKRETENKIVRNGRMKNCNFSNFSLKKYYHSRRNFLLISLSIFLCFLVSSCKGQVMTRLTITEGRESSVKVLSSIDPWCCLQKSFK